MRTSASRPVALGRGDRTGRVTRWLVAAVVLSVVGVVAPAAPAAAGTCPSWLECSVSNETSNSKVAASANWCVSGMVANQESMCETVVLNPGQVLEDADSFRLDANCTTTDGGYPYPYDRVGKGSQWLRFHDGAGGYYITAKTCYKSSGLAATRNSATQVTLSWFALKNDDGSRASDVRYRIRRNNIIIHTGTVSGNSSVSNYVDTNAPQGQPITYHVTIAYLGTNGAVAWEGPVAAVSTSFQPTFTPTYSGTHYWTTTWANAPGFNASGAQVGTLYAARNWSLCKIQWGTYTQPGTSYYNNKWLWTLLDSPAGVYGWVPAYYLSYHGNDEAYADPVSGNPKPPIENCGGLPN